MLSKTLLSDRSDRSERVNTRSRSSFARDDRAIEGLPIRLVIALVVGVAALALMLNMLGGIGDVGDTEVTVEIHDNGQIIDPSGTERVTVSVIDENGNEVQDATVIATAGSAQLEGVVEADTDGDSNEAELVFDNNQGLRADQDIGTLEIDVIPPSDSNYIDEQPNPEIRVAETS
ncbi:DUF7382 domain-containing protein [Natronorubrum bangense]|uniref:DUF7382 domain-containing protein n=2 Tax=Natronorubrum bangense TaxID=61858 RepID=L9WMH7_9EURY|nr:hypothetical protein [Natronorubrum bangense]ELY50695.1 hypothetical protein C494_04930 [Natronorubrum bangense JCM 10635]QCC54412.1 hypothetical protein DV706_07875 [Natronorubrum bangense]